MGRRSAPGAPLQRGEWSEAKGARGARVSVSVEQEGEGRGIVPEREARDA